MLSNMFSRPAQASAPAIDHEKFEQAVKEGRCVVVDVREPQEFAAGHIPNSVNLPLSTFDPGQLPDGKPVVLVCQSGRRSLHALNRARETGRDDVTHYAGGVAGWRSRRGALSR